MTVPSIPAVIEMVEMALRSYFLTPSSEPKAPGPNGILNRALKHLPQRSVSLPVQLFNADLRTHIFPIVWKHTRVIYILKPGKDSALPSSYRPVSLLDTIGKLFEKILLSRILYEVSESGLMRDELFGF
jgi:hypothetical protein